MSDIARISMGRGGLNFGNSVRRWAIVLVMATGDNHMIHGRLNPFIGTEKQKDYFVEELCIQAERARLPLSDICNIDMGPAYAESATGKQDVAAKILEFKQN